MLLAQSGKPQGFGDGVPKSYRSTKEPDEGQMPGGWAETGGAFYAAGSPGDGTVRLVRISCKSGARNWLSPSRPNQRGGGIVRNLLDAALW